MAGQASRLRQLMHESKFFQRATCSKDPMFELCNAALVYGQAEIEEITDVSAAAASSILPPCRSVLSPVTGEVLSASNASELFKQSGMEILKQPIRWDKLLQSILNKLKMANSFDGNILASGPVNVVNDLHSALETGMGMGIEMEFLASWCSEPAQNQIVGKDADSKIAIVGISGRFADATKLADLWQDIKGGLEIVKNQQLKSRSSMVNGEFDNRHISLGYCGEEFDLLDPGLAVTTAYEALEMSGFVPNRTPSTQLDRVGTFYSQTSDDWRELNRTNMTGELQPVGPRALTPGRVSHYFSFGGPSHSVDTACSSSLAAVHAACKSLRSGECDTSVVGVLDVCTAPDISAGSSYGQPLGKVGSNDSKSSKLWDRKANNYFRADSVASIVMKRIEDAENDNDNIIGVILGSATNHSGDALSIARPHAGNQSFLYQKILSSAGIDASEVNYVEMHGTCTPSGGCIDMGSVTDVLAAENDSVDGRQILYPNAAKSKIGYIEAAAGVTALVTVLLKLRKHKIPANIDNDALFSVVGFPLRKEAEPVTGRKPMLAFLNRVSVARGNTALLLQGGTDSAASLEADPYPQHVIAVSASSIPSLKSNIKNTISYVEQNPTVSLPSLAYTTTARRVHHQYRVAISVSNPDEVRSALIAKLEEQRFLPISCSPPQVAFIFTGQGVYYPCLGRQLYDVSSRFRADLEYLNVLTVHQGLPSFLPAINGSIDEGSHLPPLVQQLALVCVQMALVRLWQSWGIRPSVVVGQSLGEYAALNAAGVTSVDHTIHLVGQRGKILQDKCRVGTHGMLAVKSSVPTIERLANGQDFEVECFNSTSDTIIGGNRDNMDQLAQQLKQAGQKCMTLNLPYAFHSAQVDPVLEPYEQVVHGVVYESPRVPVISSLLGKVVNKGGVFDASYCRRHTREPVNLLGAVQSAQDKGVLDAKTVCIEIGPHPVCSGLVNSILGTANVMVPSLRKSEDPWKTLCDSLSTLHCAGLEIDWSEVHRDYESSHQLLNLPPNKFDMEDCGVDYPIASSSSPVSSVPDDFSDEEEGCDSDSESSVASDPPMIPEYMAWNGKPRDSAAAENMASPRLINRIAKSVMSRHTVA